ncbi:MAG: replication initiator protein A [Waddliaceae bacterium]
MNKLLKTVEQKPQKGKVECNFEEFPYFIPSTKNLKNQKEIVFSRNVTNSKGHTLCQEWIVRAEHANHLPGSFEADVKRALDQLVFEIGYETVSQTGSIKFSLYQIADILGLDHGGWTWKRIREALERMKTTNIHSKHSFYIKGRDTYIDDIFTFLEQVRFFRVVEGKRTRHATCEVRFSKYILESLKNHYIKPFDFGFYWSLKDPIPKRLYSLFDKRGYRSSKLTFDLIELGRTIPLTPRPPSKIKQGILPGLTLLKNRGYIKDFTFSKPKPLKDILTVYLKKQGEVDPEVKEIANSLYDAMVRHLGTSESCDKRYRKISETIPPSLIYRAISEIREEERDGEVRSPQGLFFTKIGRYVREASTT